MLGTLLLRSLTSMTAALYSAALRNPAQLPKLRQHESWLTHSLPTLTDGELDQLYEACAAATSLGHKFTQTEALALAGEAVTRFGRGRASGCFTLCKASELSTSFQQASVSLSAMLQAAALEQLSASFLLTKSLRDAHFCLLAFLKAAPTSTLYPTKAGLELVPLAESVVLKALHTAKAEDTQWLSGILRTLIAFNRSSESLLRAIEQVVFSSLPSLPPSFLLSLLSAYPTRHSPDYRYLHNSVFRPYTNEILRREASLSPSDLGLMCLRLETCRGHGLYCSAELLELLHNLVCNDHWLERNKPEAGELALQRIVHYIGQVGTIGHRETFDRVAGWLEDRRKGRIDPLTHCRLADTFARAQYTHPSFWQHFQECLPSYLPASLLATSLYSALLHLRYLQPTLYSSLTAHHSVQQALPCLATSWKRSASLRQSSLHSRTLLYLTQRNIPFQAEHWDDFHIDIALPHKVALELCGISHYVVPAMVLDGRTQARKLVLERKGWKVLIPPFYLKGADFTKALDTYFQEVLYSFVFRARCKATCTAGMLIASSRSGLSSSSSRKATTRPMSTRPVPVPWN